MANLDKRVLEEIGRRGLKPRPYAYFLARRSVFWFLAILSIVLGALSVAVMLFAAADLEATGGRGLDEMPLDDLILYLPYVWIGSLALFVASAIFSIRQTRRGHRYHAWQLIAGALALSIALGAGFHVLRAGEAVHGFLTRNVPLYERLTRFSETRRNAPAQGFLAGRIVSSDGSSLTVTDFDGATWTIDIAGAELQKDNLDPDEDIAVEGDVTGPQAFKARLLRDWD